jgi:hypothetical protein
MLTVLLEAGAQTCVQHQRWIPGGNQCNQLFNTADELGNPWLRASMGFRLMVYLVQQSTATGS